MPAHLSDDDVALAKEFEKIFEPRDRAIKELQARTQTLLQRSSRLPGSAAPVSDKEIYESPSVGQRFVAGDEFKALMGAPNQRGRAIATVGSLFERKQIITSGTIIPQTVRLPGIVAQPRRALRLRDLIPVRPFDTIPAGGVDYLRQKPRTTGAGPQVAEGDIKSEIQILTELVTGKFSTIAAWTAASRQVLMDVGLLQQFIDAELLYAVQLEEEKEILTGTGAPNGQLDGLLPAATPFNPAQSQAGDTPLDTVARAEAQLLGVDVQPTALIIHSADMAKIELLKDSLGRYLMNEPGDSDFSDQTLWGLSVVVSNSMPVDQFLLGDFTNGCALLDRQTATVEISTEHADFFTRNLIAIRCEERVALLIFSPWSFVHGTFASTLSSGAQAKQPAAQPQPAHAPTPAAPVKEPAARK
jgi:HK97 family phage major capsid protein